MALQDSTNPLAGVSGPGKFAKRTDLQFQPDQYGQGVEYQAMKSGAPLAQATPTPSATPTEVRQAAGKAIKTTGLYDQTERPNEPITTGVNIGAGPGPEALVMRNPVDGQYQSAYELIQQLAQNPDASPTLLYLAQRIQQGF